MSYWGQDSCIRWGGEWGFGKKIQGVKCKGETQCEGPVRMMILAGISGIHSQRQRPLSPHKGEKSVLTIKSCSTILSIFLEHSMENNVKPCQYNTKPQGISARIMQSWQWRYWAKKDPRNCLAGDKPTQPCCSGEEQSPFCPPKGRAVT